MHRQIAGTLTGRVTKWIVLVFWLLMFGIGGTFAQKLTDVQNNEASSWLPSSAESTRALAKLAPFQDQNDIPTIVVYERSGGLTPQDLGEIKSQTAEIQQMNGVVGQVQGPIPSKDGEVAQTIVTYNFGQDGWNKLPDTADRLREIAAIDGVTVHIAGSGGQAADSAEAFAGIDGTLLFATLGVVVLILLLTYRSPFLWILPIFSAVVALMTSEAVIYFLAKYADLTVNGQSQGILTVLVVGAGTDYALLLVARYREELRRHADRHEAMAFALHRAAPAIFATEPGLVVDLAADFRVRDPALHRRYYGDPGAPALRNRFVYGLADICGESLRGARAIAVPGCFATAAAIALYPLARAKLAAAPALYAVTGSSGAGASLKATTHHPARAHNVFAYSPLGHRHDAEITEQWQRWTGRAGRG